LGRGWLGCTAARRGRCTCQWRGRIRRWEQLGARPRTAELYQGYPFDRLRRRLGLEPRDDGSVDADDPSCMSEQELRRLDPAAMGREALAEACRSAAALGDDGNTARFAAELLSD